MKFQTDKYVELSASAETKLKAKGIKIKKDKNTKKNVVDAEELLNNLDAFKDEKITLRTIQQTDVQ